jgi:hypothetical protein
MEPVIVSAQFAAYTWFQGRRAGTPAGDAEALRFARANWRAFLPCAHKGLGRLLLRLGRHKAKTPA